MKKTVIIIVLNLLFYCGATFAQELQKSDLEQRAETEIKNGNSTTARFYFIRS